MYLLEIHCLTNAQILTCCATWGRWGMTKPLDRRVTKSVTFIRTFHRELLYLIHCIHNGVDLCTVVPFGTECGYEIRESGEFMLAQFKETNTMYSPKKMVCVSRIRYILYRSMISISHHVVHRNKVSIT